MTSNRPWELKALLSEEHFSVDGTLLQTWASHPSLKCMMARTIHRQHPQALPRALLWYGLARQEKGQG